MLPPGCVLDGELLMWGDGRSDFGALQRRLSAGKNVAALARTRPAHYTAFDLLAGAAADSGDNGSGDLRGQPLKTRRGALEGLLADAEPPLQLTPYTNDADTVHAWLEQCAQARVGIEGLVIKAQTPPTSPDGAAG